MGFVSVEENDEDGREVGDVSLRAQADYRKVEDPEWLERELLRLGGLLVVQRRDGGVGGGRRFGCPPQTASRDSVESSGA